MTGREAVLEETGETFAQVAERRRSAVAPNGGSLDPAPLADHSEDSVAPDSAGHRPDDGDIAIARNEEGGA